MGKYQISELEWKVMECLWNEDNLSLKEIVKRLSEFSWSYSTIRTMVTRLKNKGVIGARSDSSNFLYYPIAEECDCRVQESKSFLDKVFNGSIGMMISTLAKKEEISNKELEELKKIIDNIQEEN